MKKIIIQFLKISLPIILGGYLVWYMIDLVRKQNQDDFLDTVKSLNYGWITFSLFIGLFSHLARAHRWKYLLEPLGHQTSFANRYHATMVGYVVNMVLPRAGEASRAVFLGKTDGVPFSKTFGTIIAERIVDLVMLASVGLVTVMLSLHDFEVLYQSLFDFTEEKKESNFSFFLAIVVGAIMMLFILLRRNKALRAKFWNFIGELKSGVFSVFRSKNPGSFLLYSVLIWMLYILYFGVCFLALEDAQNTPVQGVLMAFIAGTIGVMLTPGGLGSYPIFVGTVISFYVYPTFDGVHNNALALATMIWLSQTLFLILLGLISLFYVSRKFPVTNA